MDETKKAADEMTNDELRNAVEEQLKKVQIAALLSGSKAICGVVLQYIEEFQKQSGKKSANDYKRLIKKITKFCAVSLGKDIDENGNVVDKKKDAN